MKSQLIPPKHGIQSVKHIIFLPSMFRNAVASINCFNPQKRTANQKHCQLISSQRSWIFLDDLLRSSSYFWIKSFILLFRLPLHCSNSSEQFWGTIFSLSLGAVQTQDQLPTSDVQPWYLLQATTISKCWQTFRKATWF